MKANFTFFVLLLFLFPFEGTHAQTGFISGSSVPLQPQSTLFGTDIVIHDSTTENQAQVKICSSFNGWLYVAYTYFSTKYNSPAIQILKSVDNGITWTVISDIVSTPFYNSYLSLDIAVIGDSISNLELFVSWVMSSDSPGYPGQGYVDQFDAITGNWVNILLQVGYCYSIALSTDFMYPATFSNPRSLGILYSAGYPFSPQSDSIIFRSSSDGGMTLNNRQILSSTTVNKFHNVALTYGRSPSWDSGRYFSAWEDKDSYTSKTGHIFRSHSNPNFNSAFSKPVCIDSIDPSAINKVRNPKIACQFSSTDNDSSNLTEVIMLEKQLSSNSYDTRGFYNLQATTSNHFNEFSLLSSSNNKTQPDINFNHYNSTFLLTYYDSTTQSLPFLTNNVNLTNPGTWNIVSQAYNDSPNLSAPYPKVALDMGQQQGADVWIKEGTGGNGVAMFDAQFNNYTGIVRNNTTEESQSFKVFPNPCNSSITIVIDLKRKETVKITFNNQIGEVIGIVADQPFSEGKSLIKYEVTNFSSGSYLLNFMGENFVQTRKVFIVK
jgi:hypothetical protein